MSFVGIVFLGYSQFYDGIMSIQKILQGFVCKCTYAERDILVGRVFVIEKRVGPSEDLRRRSVGFLPS